MYKTTILLVLVSILLSCKSIKIEGDGKNCFNKNEAIQLSNNKRDFKIFSVAPIIKSKSNCVGLYKYSHINKYMSTGVNSKVLKFENEIYGFKKNDTLLNKTKVNQFLIKYRDQFSEAEIDSIKTDFLKGDEIYGRFY